MAIYLTTENIGTADDVVRLRLNQEDGEVRLEGQNGTDDIWWPIAKINRDGKLEIMKCLLTGVAVLETNNIRHIEIVLPGGE